MIPEYLKRLEMVKVPRKLERITSWKAFMNESDCGSERKETWRQCGTHWRDMSVCVRVCVWSAVLW